MYEIAGPFFLRTGAEIGPYSSKALAQDYGPHLTGRSMETKTPSASHFTIHKYPHPYSYNIVHIPMILNKYGQLPLERYV